MIVIEEFSFTEMSFLVEYLLSELKEIVAELLLSWENCDENVTICDSGNSGADLILY